VTLEERRRAYAAAMGAPLGVADAAPDAAGAGRAWLRATGWALSPDAPG